MTASTKLNVPNHAVLWVVAALTLVLTIATGYGLMQAGLFGAPPQAGIIAVLVPAIVAMLLGRFLPGRLAKGLLLVASLCVTIWIIGAGGVLGVALLLLASLAAGDWVLRLDRSPARAPGLQSATLALSVGLAVLGLAYTFLAHLPVTSPGTVFITLIVISALGWRSISRFAGAFRQWLTLEAKTSWWTWFAAGLLAAAMLINVGYASLPGFSGDTIAMHLYIPSYTQAFGKWSFDFQHFSFAVMPLLGDLLFVPSYMLGDLAGAQLLNAVAASLVALLLFCTVRPRVGTTNALLCATAWLLIPLVLLESANLHVETIETLFVFAAFVYLADLDAAPANPHGVGAISGLLVSAAVATKLPAFILCPMLLVFVLVVFGRRHGAKWAVRAAVTAALVVVTIGSFQYWYALEVTGNPVYFFYNGIFLSPYSDAKNFVDGNYIHRLDWDLPLGLIFKTNYYGEIGPGGLGFQWTVLVLPALILAMFTGGGRARWAGLMGFFYLLMVLLPEQYMRYTLPAFPFLSVLVSEAAAPDYLLSQIAFRVAMIAVIAFNTLAMHGVNFHFNDLPWRPIFSWQARGILERRIAPAMSLNRTVNSLQNEPSKVLYFSKRDGGGLQGMAYYQGWFQSEIDNYTGDGPITPEAIGALIADNKIEYVEIDTSTSKHRRDVAAAQDFCDHHAQAIAKSRGMVLYRVDQDALYSRAALSNPTFADGAKDWVLDDMAKPLKFVKDQGLSLDDKEVIRQRFNLKGYTEGQEFFFSADVNCLTTTGDVSAIVVWALKNNEAKLSVTNFSCVSLGPRHLSQVFLAPKDARTGALRLAATHGVRFTVSRVVVNY